MSDPQTSNSTPLYAFAECEAIDTSNGGVLLLNKHSDAQLLVGGAVAHSMQMCRVFRTLDQHVEVLTSSIPELAGQQQDVMGVLQMLLDAGLLVSASSVCERLNAEVAAPVDLPPTRVFIVTCDRPAAVKRLLESMLHAGNLTRHEELFLIDDSRDPANAELNRAAAADFNFTCPRNMNYVGASEAKLLLNKLVAQLPAHEQGIRFLIDRERWGEQKSYGLARNLCLLLSIDCRAIVLDDDVICAAVESPHKGAGLQFGERPREIDFYSSQQDILSRTKRADFDPLSGHALCLGLNIGQAIVKLSGNSLTEAQLEGASSAYLSQWNAQSQVLVTQSGTLGDPGTPSTEWVYTISSGSSARLAQSAGGVQGALVNRQYWMGQPRPMFTKMAAVSQMTGLDNSQLLPPYFPVFRSEDYLFSAMVEHIHPQSAVLEYDWSVPHFPLDERSGDSDPAPLDGKGEINASKYITDRTRYEPAISPETRLCGLAQIAQELSETSSEGLLILFRKEVAEYQGGELARLNAYFQDGSIRPPDWQDWLQRSLNAISASLQTKAKLTDLKAVPAHYSEQMLLAEFRIHLADFSRGLESWRQTREAAQQITGALLTANAFTP